MWLAAAAIAMVLVVGIIGSVQPASAGSTPPIARQAKKAKKCARGFKKQGKKCKRRVLKVASVNLVVGLVKDGQVKVTGWSDFGYTTTSDAFFRAKVVVSDGIGIETKTANWFVAKGSNHTNFTGSWPVGLNKPNMSVQVVVGGVGSNIVVDPN